MNQWVVGSIPTALTKPPIVNNLHEFLRLGCSPEYPLIVGFHFPQSSHTPDAVAATEAVQEPPCSSSAVRQVLGGGEILPTYFRRSDPQNFLPPIVFSLLAVGIAAAASEHLREPPRIFRAGHRKNPPQLFSPISSSNFGFTPKLTLRCWP